MRGLENGRERTGPAGAVAGVPDHSSRGFRGTTAGDGIFKGSDASTCFSRFAVNMSLKTI